MEKSAKEWFAQLPETIRSQAIENSWGLNKQYSNLAECLSSNFAWFETPQGRDYWQAIYARAESGEFGTNLHGWILVSDRLPTAEDGDEFGDVLIYRSDTLNTQQDSCKSIIKWDILKHSNTDSTFWQPLPKLPEVKGGENA